MKEFRESGLHFRFDDRWDVCQLDTEADYRNKIARQIPETRSIDFIGFNETKKILLFVEVKSFRGYGNRKNIRRLTGAEDGLTIEIAQKVRDSLATIIGGARHSTHFSDTWKKYVSHLNQGETLKVIAWVELDVHTQTMLSRAKINMGTRRRELKKRLTWLTSDVQILNTRDYAHEIEGMEVTLM